MDFLREDPAVIEGTNDFLRAFAFPTNIRVHSQGLISD